MNLGFCNTTPLKCGFAKTMKRRSKETKYKRFSYKNYVALYEV